MNKKDKIGIIVKLGNKEFRVLLSSLYEEKKLIRYVKASLSKSGVDIIKESKEFFLKSIEKCPFCEQDSKYEIEYEIFSNSIKIIGINLLKNQNGWTNYHCLSGKNYCSGSKLNPNSIEYISKAYRVSPEDSRKFILNRNKSPFYRNNHDSEESYKKFQSRDADYYISRYGEKDGRKKIKEISKNLKNKLNKKHLIEKYGIDWYERMSKKKANCTLSYYINKYGAEEGIIKYNKRISDLSKNTKENFIKKYGEDKWKKRVEIFNYKNSLEYFINTLGYDKGVKRFEDLRKSYSFTREDYIKKYGEDQWIEKRSKINGKKFYSKEAKRFFEILLEKINEKFGMISNLKWLEDEFFIWDNEYRRIYFYDFYFKINDIKIIIEYDNIFWHPRKNKDGSFNKNCYDFFSSILTPEEKMEYDERKINIAKYRGYNIIVIETEKMNLLRDQYKYNSLIEEALTKIEGIINKIK